MLPRRQKSENWEEELEEDSLLNNMEVISNELSKSCIFTSVDDLGSGDESERNINAEMEAFGLSEDDSS